MPKLPFKRKAVDENASINAYLPTQMVDYTSLPPIEEETGLTKFKRLPLPLRIGAVLLPLLLLAGAGWGGWLYMTSTPPLQAVAPPAPVVTISSARVVSKDAIAVEAQTQQVADGTPVTAELLDKDTPIAWADTKTVSGTIQSGKATLRLTKAGEGATPLDAKAGYTVRVTVGQGANAVTSQLALEVPALVADAFFEKAPMATPAPTTAPTAEPTAAPTPAPTVAPGPPTIEVAIDSTLLISPTLGSATIGNVQLGAKFTPLLRSSDNKWFLVKQGEQVAWIYADQVKVDPASLSQIALVTPDAKQVAAGPFKATVGNGGNIRYTPNMKTGTVLGQLHAGQQITLKLQTPDGQWFRVVAPAAEGWVSVTLLTITPDVQAKVPVSK